MGAVFGIAGLVGLVLIVSVLTFALRRARRSRLENDAADVDGTIDWSADAGVGGSMGNTSGAGYTGMPIIGQLERSGTSLNRTGSGRSNASRNASDSPVGSDDGLLGTRSGSANGYYSNYGASAEGPAASNLGRRPSNGEQLQSGMTMNNAMPVSMPLNRAVSVNRQEGAPVNVPGQLYIPPSLAMSNASRPYGAPQQQQQQAQPKRQSIRAYAFQQQRQQTTQLPYAQPRSFSPQSQQAQIGAYPTAQHGRNGSDSDGANTFGRTRSGSGGSRPDSPNDESDYYAEYNYGGQNVKGPSGLRVANE